MSEQLERTPRYDRPVAADAKIVPFAGFEMPVQYPTGITAEHCASTSRTWVNSSCAARRRWS